MMSHPGYKKIFIVEGIGVFKYRSYMYIHYKVRIIIVFFSSNQIDTFSGPGTYYRFRSIHTQSPVNQSQDSSGAVMKRSKYNQGFLWAGNNVGIYHSIWCLSIISPIKGLVCTIGINCP